MKSVLISIHPKWCELIASGKKTIEVRKTYPKLPTPFRCYICRPRHGAGIHSREAVHKRQPEREELAPIPCGWKYTIYVA